MLGISILIVEDDPASARLLAAQLAVEGADNVRIAHDAEEALAILEAVPIRALVVDVVLPRMSGLSLVRRIKSVPSTRDILAVATSGMDTPAMQREALDSGCAGFIRKPIDGGRLAAILRGARHRPAVGLGGGAAS